MNRTNRKQRQRKEARLSIVSKHLLAGLSYKQIAQKVYEQTGFKPSKSAICRDVKDLLNEWRSWKLSKIEDLTALELERIDQTISLLWQQWDQSKALKPSISTKKTGIVNDNRSFSGNKQLQTVEVQEFKQLKQPLGDVRYIAEIRKQLKERRRLLGLYPSDKQCVKTYILPINHYHYSKR